MEFSSLLILFHFLLFKPFLQLSNSIVFLSSCNFIPDKEQIIQKTQEVEKQANLEMSLYRASQLKQTKEKLDRILNEKKMQLEKKKPRGSSGISKKF